MLLKYYNFFYRYIGLLDICYFPVVANIIFAVEIAELQTVKMYGDNQYLQYLTLSVTQNLQHCIVYFQ